jgi:hypothetical protein
MGCCLSKREPLLQTTPKSEIGQYVDLDNSNIEYSNPIYLVSQRLII